MRRTTVGAAVRIALFLAVLMITSGTAYAQQEEASVRGFVTAQATGGPLPGANVALQAIAVSDASPRGAVADADGSYLITGLAPGRYRLRASFVGYRPFVDTLALEAGQARAVSVALSSREEALEAVEVEDERPGAAGITAGRQQIRPEDIERVPTPDVSGDLASYLTVQPGVVTTGDRGGQLFIRGGEPSQNVVELDGMPLYQPFHLLGFYSAFPADIINTVDVYAGGYGAEYGGGLSAVIDVASREGNKKRYAGAVSVSPFVTSAQVEGPVPLLENRVSFLGHARRSVLEQGAARYVGQPLPFVFSDVFGKVHARLSPVSRLSVTGLATYDRGTIGAEARAEPPGQMRYRNQALGLRYLFFPSFLPIQTELTAGYARLESELLPQRRPRRSSVLTTTRVALEATYPREHVDWDAGWEMDFINVDTELGGLYQNLERRVPPTLAQLGAYVVPTFDLGGGLTVRPGVRAQFYNVRFDPYVAPRVRMVWERGRHQVSGAVGLYHQEVIGLSDRRDAANVFTAWTNVPKRGGDVQESEVLAGRLGEALHGLLGYQVRPASWLTASVEGFYKSMGNLFVSEWTAFPRFATTLQPARGRSFGVEARVEVRRPSFYVYANYGYSNTRYQAGQHALGVWFGNETYGYRPPHDRRHQVNLLASTTLYDVDLSVRWAFGSGRPFSQAKGFDYFMLIDDVVDASRAPFRKRVTYEDPFNAVLPTYHRLDAAASYAFTWGPAKLTVQVSAINAYDRRNIFYLDIFTLERVDQLPVVPSLGLKLEFIPNPVTHL